MIIHSRRVRRQGFALPTVVVSSVILLMLLTSAVVAMSSIRVNIDDQYYNRLAREAAEAGAVYAKNCLDANSFIAAWTDASPLRPNTACTGGSECTNSDSCFIINDASNRLRSTFRVNKPLDYDGHQLLAIEGKVELVRNTGGAAWKVYAHQSRARISMGMNFLSLALGYNTNGSYFLTIGSDGTPRGTGYNANGQLGTGNTSNVLTPTSFILPTGIKARKLYTGANEQGYGVFLVTTGDKLYAAGKNDSGQLGIGSLTATVSTPQEVTLPLNEKVVAVLVNDLSSFMLTDANNIYAAGDCDYGRLGTNYTISSCSDKTTFQRVALPTVNSADLNTIPTENIATDAYTTLVLMRGGRVYGWGANYHGQLGQGDLNDRSSPVTIGAFGASGQPKAIQVATTGSTSYILDENGDVYGTGDNDRGGQLGLSSSTPYSTSLVKLAITNVKKMATDSMSVSCLTNTGEVWSLGWNNAGQLGSGTPTSGYKERTPVKFQLPAGVKGVDLVSATVYDNTVTKYNNTFVIGDDGKVYGAGGNDYGQLGIGNTTSSNVPVAMQAIDGVDVRASQITAGLGTAVIRATNGKVYTVGNNTNGQLGDGTTTHSSIPAARQYINVTPLQYF